MFDENLIREALATGGFFPEAPLIYCHPSKPSEVRHFLFFNLWGVPKQYLAAVYGFGNAAADNFAAKCVRKYGGEVYGKWEEDRAGDPVTRLSLGRLAGWEPRDSIRVRNCEACDIAVQVITAVERCVMPVVRKAAGSKELLGVLMADAEPCPWVITNGAARAAQIVFLGLRAGISSQAIRTFLQSRSKHIAAHITSGVGVQEFVDRIIEEALRDK